MITTLRFALLALAALLVGFVPNQGRPATRWALIVGVGDYLNYGNEVGGDLPGATVDAKSMYEVLTERWGFDKPNVRLILDTAATRAAIEEGLTGWLPSVAQPGDLVVFYYAGHGGQTWDRNGDEADGLDETICPTDVLRKSTSKDIRDDELATWLKAIPTDNVTVIFDSCHSGTATRALTPHARPRSIARALSDIPRDEPAAAPAVATRGAAARPSGSKSGLDYLGDGVLEIAAAQSDQYSMETVWESPDGGLPRSGGVFTTPFVKYLWQVPVGTSYEEVFRLARAAVKERGFAQNPQLTTSVGSALPLFALGRGARLASSTGPAPSAQVVAAPGRAPSAATGAAATAAEVAGAQPVTVVATRSDTVEVSGGDQAGITVGSVYRVGGSVFRVARVGAKRAFATLFQTRGVTVTNRPNQGDAVELVAYSYPEPELRVGVSELPTAAHAALATAVKALPAIRLDRDAQALSDLIVRRRGADLVVLGKDGFLRQTIAGGDMAALATQLRQELGARQLAALDNPAHPFALEFGFGDDRTSLRVGDRVHFRVRSARDGYLTIVDVDAAGKVSVIFPSAVVGTDNRVRAGQELLLPGAATDGTFQIVPPAGHGVVRAFLTERPMAIPFAEADAAQADAVERALRAAVGQAPLPGGAVPVDNWATASVAYEIAP